MNPTRKKQAQKRKLRAFYNELDRDPKNRMCFFYPNIRKADYEHIVAKAHSEELILDPRNLIPVSRYAHDILTNKPASVIKQLPRIHEYLDKMRELDEQFFYRYLGNREELAIRYWQLKRAKAKTPEAKEEADKNLKLYGLT